MSNAEAHRIAELNDIIIYHEREVEDNRSLNDEQRAEHEERAEYCRAELASLTQANPSASIKAWNTRWERTRRILTDDKA